MTGFPSYITFLPFTVLGRFTLILVGVTWRPSPNGGLGSGGRFRVSKDALAQRLWVSLSIMAVASFQKNTDGGSVDSVVALWSRYASTTHMANNDMFTRVLQE